MKLVQKGSGSVIIRDIGRCNHDENDQPYRINQWMTFASLDVLTTVISNIVL